MKERKVWLLIAIICVAIVITIIGIVILKNTERKVKDPEVEDERNTYSYYQENPAQVVNGKKPAKTNIIGLYSMVDECIKSYYSMIKAGNSEIVLSYLNEDFIKANSINQSNIYNFIKKYNDYSTYRTMDMYDLGGMTYTEYYVKGKINGVFVYFLVGTDINNETFDIMPIQEAEYNNYLEKVANTEESTEKIISKKVYNFYRVPIISDEDLSRKYYVDYIKLMLTDSEQAYSMLNEQYKKIRFGSIENFKNYITNNRQSFIETYNVETADIAKFKNYDEYNKYVEAKAQYKMKSYAVNNYNEYTQCVCGNIAGNNYIFNAKYPMDYEVYLDTFTVDLPEFIEKYSNASEKNKVLMNIEKVKNALNTNVYGYMYSKLDETFKKNKFPNQNIFVEYMRKNLFALNKFEYTSIKQDGKLYIIETTVTDATAKNNAKRTMNVVMKLNEGTDFVMSFSFN